MPTYNAPIKDFEFLLYDLLDVEQYKDIPCFAEVSKDLVSSLLSEGAKLCEEVLFPLNQPGDQEGCHFSDGKVTLPRGFKDAYQTYIGAGWTGFTCDKAYGGQGLPDVINMPIIEMICSANLSFGILPGLTHGAYNAIYKHGTDELKSKYLPKLVDGSWSGVMCLTEAQCGTDLGLIETKAQPNNDGSYKITGSKIFISAGEQDATENIIHLVLARLPDAVEGVKGISLFLVPKLKVNDNGSIGEHNNVTCGSIEHKMGIHASPTCVINYEGSIGYLVGEPHKGLRAMFTMMNEARLYVGVQGLGLAETAYQNAAAYAKERLQGRALKGAKYPDKKADPIIVHPDVRRMLLTMRSFTEGARALMLLTALKLDVSKHHSDEETRQEADDFVQFITPVLKAYLTDAGFESTNLAMQVYGGHGYIKEYGIEQYVRDARIAQIYEGANGIQALDLVGRKLPKYTGRFLRSFFHPAMQFVEDNRENTQLSNINKALYKALDSAQNASLWIAANGMSNPDDAAASSAEYLRLIAITVMGYLWAKMAKIAIEKLERGEGDKNFYQDKLDVAKFFMLKILPCHYGLLGCIVNGSASVMSMDDCQF